MSDVDPFSLCGTTIDGKYRVLSVVGEGGFGVVYRAVHEGFDAPVAVKCLKLPPHFDLAAQDVLVKQLREEGRTLLRLSQRTPGILQALDVGSFTTPSGARVPYLVLEWLDGRTLAEELVIRQRLSLREAFTMLDPAARALTVAHEEKVAHRDIKPENIFCLVSGGKPTVKILDFGIAKLLGESATPQSGTAMGTMSMFTPGYGAPEQFDKTRGGSGPWTDVFAFALVFVELVTGKAALDGDGLFALFQASIDPVTRPTPRSRGIAAPEAVEQVLRKALEPAPAERYPDMGSFWSALETAMQSVDDGRPGSDAGPPRDIARADTMQLAPGQTTGPVTGPGAGQPTGATAPATNLDVGTTARSAQRGRGPSVAWVLLCAVVLAAAAAGVVFVVHGRMKAGSTSVGSSAGGPVASASAGPSPSALPATTNPEAAVLYRDAMQAWHDGRTEVALRTMEKAGSVDRELGAAQLRVALWHFILGGIAVGKQAEAREHYQAALLHRATMNEVDKGLIAAAEPYMRQPQELHEWVKHLEELTKKYPKDAELLVYLGEAHQQRLQPDNATISYEHALAADPTLAVAHAAEAESLALKGDTDGQAREYRLCLESSPQATQCVLRQMALRAQIGKCGPMKADAQHLLALDPNSPDAQRELALALSATGSPAEAVLEAFSRSWALEPAAERKAVEQEDRSAIAALVGDFVGAEHPLEEWQAAVADKGSQSAHLAPAQHLAELYAEMGLTQKASDAADAFLRRMNAWTEQNTGNPTMLLAAYRLHAGAITREEYERTRTEAVEKFRAKWTAAGRRVDEDFAWLSWAMAYGVAVGNADDARIAADAMPKVPSKAVESGRWPQADLAIGKTDALIGSFEHAVAPLRRVATPCLTLSDPIMRVPAEYYLGMALEGTGDLEGARSAYKKVVERWGKAKPKSVTAEAAKKRLQALGERKK